jgi:hypothetical protein
LIGQHFRETQRFHQWWIWLLVLIAPAVSVWAFVQQIVFGNPWGNNPASDLVLIILVIVFGIGLPVFMYSLRLITEVRDDGIYVKFSPFHFNWVIFSFDDIDAWEVQTYNPLKDFGGWGIRYGWKGKAYNVHGNRGVLLSFKDGKSVLIGSQRADELGDAISEYVRP